MVAGRCHYVGYAWTLWHSHDMCRRSAYAKHMMSPCAFRPLLPPIPRGQRVIRARNLLATLRSRDIDTAARTITAETGLSSTKCSLCCFSTTGIG